jgi:hypothetical protein
VALEKARIPLNPRGLQIRALGKEGDRLGND